MQIHLNQLSDTEQAAKRKQRRNSLIFGFILSLSIYAFFVIQYFFFLECKPVSYFGIFLIGFFYCVNFFMSLGMISLSGMSTHPEKHLTSEELKFEEKMIQMAIDSYYPDGTNGKMAEKAFLFFVTVPYYFVVAFILQNIPLLFVLFWARLNMVAYENMQKHFYMEITNMQKSSN